MIKYKMLIIRLVTVPLFLIGAFCAIVGAAHLSDEGWMTTLEALGGSSNVRMTSWMYAIGGTILAMASTVIFILTFIPKKLQKSS